MKKMRYIQPSTDIIKVDVAHHLLQLSSSGNRATINGMGTGDGSDAASRGGGWLDDEE